MNPGPASAFVPGQPGLYYGLPMAEYLKAPGLSFSSLKILRRSPLQYRRMMDGLTAKKSSAAQQFGSILHSAILEGRLDGYHVRPDHYDGDDAAGKKWNSNATVCKQWLAQHSDKPVLDAAEAKEVAESVAYVRGDARAGALLRGGKSEVSMFAEIDGRLFKGRSDYLKFGPEPNDADDTDLKSCCDGSTGGFSREIYKYAYHAQAAIRMQILKALGYRPRYYLIAFEKGDLPLVNVWKLAHPADIAGWKWVQEALCTLQQCEFANRWPDYADWLPEIQEIDLPMYAYKMEPMELTIGGETTVL